MITTAELISNIKDINDLLNEATYEAVDADQNWEYGFTRFTFEDGSTLEVSGDDVEFWV